jgi:uncharacterized protein
MKKILLLVSLFLITGWDIGCDKGPPADSVVLLPTTTMQIGGQTFVLEKAITAGEQMTGLMRRDSMAPDHGMIFIYTQEQPQRYWNKNVRFPLDNLFLDHNGKIVSIQHMEPFDETGTNEVMGQYVIELNAGIPAKLGVKEGDTLQIPADAK